MYKVDILKHEYRVDILRGKKHAQGGYFEEKKHTQGGYFETRTQGGYLKKACTGWIF